MGEIQEVDLDDLLMDDDSFEMMVDDEELPSDDTFVGDANEVEQALAESAADEPVADADADADPNANANAPEEPEEDDARENSFFKKLFG